MRLPKSFTLEKVELLRELYPSSSKDDILSAFPEYIWRSIQNIANCIGIKRSCQTRRGDLSVLLNGSIESSYWLGLFASDGSIVDGCTFKIALNVGDLEYLKKLALYLNSKVSIYPP